MTKLSKILRIVAAAAFLTALAVNVKVTLTDPFVGMSQEAIATGTDSGTGNCPGGTCSYYNSGWVINPNTGEYEWKEALVCSACCAEGQTASCSSIGCECLY